MNDPAAILAITDTNLSQTNNSRINAVEQVANLQKSTTRISSVDVAERDNEIV